MAQEKMEFTPEEIDFLNDFIKDAGTIMYGTLGEIGKLMQQSAQISKESAERALQRIANDFNRISGLARKYALKADEYGMAGDGRMQDLLDKKSLELKGIATHLQDVRYEAELKRSIQSSRRYIDGTLKRILGEAGGIAVDAVFVIKHLLENDCKQVAGDFGGMLGGIIGYGIAIWFGANPIVALIVGGAIGGMLLEDAVEDLYDDLVAKCTDLFEWLDPLGWINPDVNLDYEAAKNWHHPCDPFTLDLDGDGIETSAIAGWSGLKFDHDADGVKEGTGWVSADDGLLVLDRDGNGAIESGRELFGDNTLLSNGQLAANAYEALADQDGNGDGKIDASDSVFNDLCVWQDKNHDGVSQADELHTLAELGINSISTESTGARLDQNGNRVTATGTFLRTDGSTGQTGSLMLAGSSFFTEFTDQIEIPETHRELPDMHGSGAVRYLREAAVLSLSLTEILESYQAAATRDEQSAMLDRLLSAWASTSGMKSMQQRAQDAGFVVIYEFGDMPTPELPQLLQLAGSQEANTDDNAEPQTIGEFWQASMDSMQRVEYQRWFNIISVLERFNGEEFLNFTIPEPTSPGVMSIDFENPYRGSVGGRLSTTWCFTKVSISQQQLDLLESSYNSLRESVYQGLLLQTRLKPLLDSIDLTLNEAGEIMLDFSNMESLMQQNIQDDAANGLIDVFEFMERTKYWLQENGWGGWNFIGETLRALSITDDVQTVLDEFGVRFVDTDGIVPAGSAENETILGGDGANTLNGGGGNDIVAGVDGNDTLYGNDGADTLYGGEGNDTLDGGRGFDRYIGGSGDDVLGGVPGSDDYGNGTRGSDGLFYGNRYEGGVGNDLLLGTEYGDTYVFNLGDGQDVIQEVRGQTGMLDTLVFGEGISSADISVKREGTNLVFSYVNGTDKVTVQNWYGSDKNQLERVTFRDGTEWRGTDLHAQGLVLIGTESDETLHGVNIFEDVIYGLGGDDILNGYDGNDILYGGEGNDELHGGRGSDTYIGGAGNDILGGVPGSEDYGSGTRGSDGLFYGNRYEGGTGNDLLLGTEYGDTYVFNLGDGQDVIQEVRGQTGMLDTLVFGEGISSADISVKREGTNLVFSHVNGTDKVTVQNWYGSDKNQLERVTFRDGTEWRGTDLHAQGLVLLGTESGETLHGVNIFEDVIYGLGGNDTLYGYDGADVLFGGEGNDTLDGGRGYDRYIGGSGDDILGGAYGSADYRSGTRGSGGLFYGNRYEGGTGNDLLRGTKYGDTYVFNPGDGRDVIREISGQTGTIDTLVLGDGIRNDQLWFEKAGNDLNVSVIGTEDGITINNWYGSSDSQIESFVTAEGDVLTNTRVDQLVAAMAAFSPPTPGQMILPENMQDELAPVIAVSWQ